MDYTIEKHTFLNQAIYLNLESVFVNIVLT